MNFFNENIAGILHFCKKQPVFSGFYHSVRRMEFQSKAMERKVIIDVVYPTQPGNQEADCRVLVLNDGQDLAALDFVSRLDRMHTHPSVQNLVTLAIHAGDRLHEYGVSGIPDFKGRGSRAAQYQKFLSEELFTDVFFALNLNCTNEQVAIAGCSLGGLAAFDFAFNFPNLTSIVACFSGSFWWRSRDLGAGYTDSDRIMHRKVQASPEIPLFKVWMEVGTQDETRDRNMNGVIDAIDDVKDLLEVLKQKGLPPSNMFYQEIEGGEHNPQTWGKAMPGFLEWAFAG